MSASATPITPARFAAALPELPLANLHAKGAELRNSIAHLQISNQELQPFADEGDAECREAIEENKSVIASMEERIDLLRSEVEGRGFLWDHGKVEENGGDEFEVAERAVSSGAVVNGHGSEGGQAAAGPTGREERDVRLREGVEEVDDGDAGLHI